MKKSIGIIMIAVIVIIGISSNYFKGVSQEAKVNQETKVNHVGVEVMIDVEAEVKAVENVELSSENVLNELSDYNLFAPLRSTETYLMDMDKSIVHTWSSLYNPGNSVYMNEDGSLLRTGALKDDNAKYSVGGSGGIVERIEWNGQIILLKLILTTMRLSGSGT